MKIIKSKDFINAPLVSIIIPSYNRGGTIRKTIDSIFQQQCNFDFEIIIGDDCSTDNVRDILLQYQKSYPQNIKLIFHEQNLGLGANWASCVKICRGKYLAGCDNDDFWHNPNKLKHQVDFLEKNPEYGMIHTDYCILNRKTGKKSEIIIHNRGNTESLIKEIFTGKFKCCNSSVMYRKSIIDKFVFLDDYISNKFPLQDWNTWISISNYTKFYCLPVSTTTVGIETESITRPGDYNKLKQRFKDEKVMYKYLCEKFPDDLAFNEFEYDRYVYGIFLNLAYRKTDYKVAREYAQILKKMGSNDFKTIIAHNKIYFYTYSALKRLKEKIN